jgi:hypothetical protein
VRRPEHIAEMLRRDGEEWRLLCAVLDAHPGGPVHDAESPEWEARHVYAHLARWINNSMDDFEALRDGRPRPPAPGGDDDTINAGWRAEDADLTFPEARERAQLAYQRRLRLIESLPAERWNQPMDLIARADGHEHYANHRRYIERGR